jgi:hypothetical protein
MMREYKSDVHNTHTHEKAHATRTHTPLEMLTLIEAKMSWYDLRVINLPHTSHVRGENS